MAEPETLIGRERPMEEERRSMFCKYHYKGVLILVIPIICCPILFNHQVFVYRYLYILTVSVLYFIFNVMPAGIIAFMIIIFAPPLGVDSSKPLCVGHYGDLIYQFITVVIVGMMMDGSKLSIRLAYFMLRTLGSSIRRIHLCLMTVTVLLALWLPTTFAAAVMMRIAVAIMEEIQTQGVFAIYSNEEPYEYNSKPYPTWPVVGIYLTIAWSAVVGGFCSPLNGPNTYWYRMFEKYIPDAKIGFGTFYEIMIPVMIIELIVIYIWVQIVFFGLLPISNIRENMKAASAASGEVKEAVLNKSNELGGWTFHLVMCILVLIVGIILFLLRRPVIFGGIDNVIKKSEISPAVLTVFMAACAFMIPANLLFIRYCTCFAPAKEATTPALTSWKAVNTSLPWSHLFYLAFGIGAVGAGKRCKFYKLMADTLIRAYIKGKSIAHLQWYCIMYGIMTTMISPADLLIKTVPHDLFKAGHKLGIGGGTFAIPYALALHPAFMMPSGSGPTALIAGWGNVRTWQMFLTGIVPTLAGFILVEAFFKMLASSVIPDFDAMQYSVNFTAMEATTKKK